MSNQTFSLQPFPSNESLPNLKISGNITRNGNQLAIRYMLEGDLKEIAIFLPSNTPLRKHKLWEDTCFEFFLGIKDSQRYWEFNLSPAGHWNVYRLDGYRQGMQEETAFENLPFSVHNQADGFALALDVDLDKIISANQEIEIGITTVVKDRGGSVTYWALTHLGAEADFHLRDSFMIKL
ncbi:MULTISPECIES: DOMON-like domain-containing protein [unclassified Nostoc]|uniref:DOMON-like domain-containing protein n=1 Tax=unclassified Nostoc TaxID=2593658 RepID=UPI002AD3994F|nr:DOMON-like domain-containing protein [Nostoc sp. DedQUE03]MDZ7971550.1 DOMON-like domain-containing protein [Nostoc sp. DedQUE03]MDZ8046229.1 DOMON-like domain-containing protein [Nostoc sp. DedQUE02]